MCGRSPDVWQKPTRLLLLLALAHFQCLSTNWALFKHRSLPECHGWPKCHKKMSQSSNHIKLEHSCEFTVLKWTPQTPDLNLTEHLGCSGTGHQHHSCTSNKSAATVWCCHVNMGKNLRGMFWHLRSDFVSFPLRFLLGYLLEYYDNNYVQIFNHLRPDEWRFMSMWCGTCKMLGLLHYTQNKNSSLNLWLISRFSLASLENVFAYFCDTQRPVEGRSVPFELLLLSFVMFISSGEVKERGE